MKLYRDADGKWVGTQADAGNKNIIEVPVDKPGLLEWLNANARNDVPLPADSDSGGGTAESDCPKCKLNPLVARERATRMVAGMTAEAMAKWIEEAPTGKVADLMVAMADRYQCKSQT